MQKEPLILTLRLDKQSQAFFDEERRRYFPADRNYLKAHLTLFHQLPNDENTELYFASYDFVPFELQVVKLINLGSGVAYGLESNSLIKLHKEIAVNFANNLIRQDRQPLRPHITIMNKTTPEMARLLLTERSADFLPFGVEAVGLDLWRYLGGPWAHFKAF